MYLNMFSFFKSRKNSIKFCFASGAFSATWLPFASFAEINILVTCAKFIDLWFSNQRWKTLLMNLALTLINGCVCMQYIPHLSVYKYTEECQHAFIWWYIHKYLYWLDNLKYLVTFRSLLPSVLEGVELQIIESRLLIINEVTMNRHLYAQCFTYGNIRQSRFYVQMFTNII